MVQEAKEQGQRPAQFRYSNTTPRDERGPSLSLFCPYPSKIFRGLTNDLCTRSLRSHSHVGVMWRPLREETPAK